MNKILLLFLLFFAVPVYAFNPLQVCTGAVVSGGCSSCSTESDIIDDGNVADGSIGTTFYRAKKIVIASEICVTGIFATLSDSGEEYTVTAEVYSNNATPNPDEPDSIYGVGFTKLMAIPSSQERVEFKFSEIQTLPIGTYWIVLKPDGAGNINFGIDTDGVGTYAYYSGGWDASASGILVAGLIGCTP